MERWTWTFLLCSFVLFINVTSGQDNVCHRPQLNSNIEVEELQRYFSPGTELVLSCVPGYTPVSGPRKIVCSTSGQWTPTKLLCIPKRCPYPDPLTNGEMYYEDTVYQSTINYTCNEGYVLTGSDSAECLANGTWSTPVPECLPVSCGLAPIPRFGMIIYDKRIRGNSTDFGIGATYRCLPPFVIVGNARAECTADGTWTKTPECQVVTCPPPGDIARGYKSSNDDRDYDYLETVRYGCDGNFVLEGNFEVVCQANGKWSEKPSCKAPCGVGLKRGRILYNGRKIWIEDLNPNRVLHNEIVSVYCLDNARNCGYAVPTQCIDGKLKIPDCYNEPGATTYRIYSSSLPSEITQC